jgi:hypothetical protein
MPRQLSKAAKQAVYAQSTSEVFIILLTISHPDFLEDIRVASDLPDDLPDAGVKGVLSRGMEFIFLPFAIDLPNQDDSGVARANIQIDNIDRQIVYAVRKANSALSIKIEIILASDPDNPEITIEDFKLEKVTYDAFTVSGDLSVEYYDLEPFPARRFTPSDFPGLF